MGVFDTCDFFFVRNVLRYLVGSDDKKMHLHHAKDLCNFSLCCTNLSREEDVFEEVHGENVLKRVVRRNGVKEFYEGPRGRERLYRVNFTFFQCCFQCYKTKKVFVVEEEYEGDRGQEALRERCLARVSWPYGSPLGDLHYEFYRGPRGEEAKWKATGRNGCSVYFYEGGKGQEALRREEDSYGQSSNIFYEGPPGKEVKYKEILTIMLYTSIQGPAGRNDYIRSKTRTLWFSAGAQ